MKGIVLAGGSGTRLYPLTLAISKQLLPIYDKPMIYYPISVLMLAGIRDILIISTPEDLPNFERLLGSGSKFGVKFTYREQLKPYGLAHAFLIGRNFIGNDSVAMILGDNIFYGHKFTESLKKAKATIESKGGAVVFGHQVKDPERFGVIEFDKNWKVISIEEKPEFPKSNYAVTGLYFYDNTVSAKAETLSPSKRNELEITDLNKLYLNQGKLNIELLGRGFAWLDTGTHESLSRANQYIKTVEENQGIKIACLEEIAIKSGFISKDEVMKNISTFNNNEYYQYIKNAH